MTVYYNDLWKQHSCWTLSIVWFLCHFLRTANHLKEKECRSVVIKTYHTEYLQRDKSIDRPSVWYTRTHAIEFAGLLHLKNKEKGTVMASERWGSGVCGAATRVI
ncbi:hypothetical protein TNCV_3107641 [Trichonephila clavipes]|uniref:Uncharacterized protein n=1 Tax=Trichonephila clavipes TaxID=2585209 RepID=A0A8X6S7H3_TRICX|nr:hypothetical protein TNCV_3107641 [Trichonephila clavipes]